MLRIGFTQKYFTLWSVTSTPRFTTDWTGKSHQVGVDSVHTYIQNLSMNEDKAIEKARVRGVTDLVPDTDLYGKNRSFRSYSSWNVIVEEKSPHNFQFGKYYDNPIKETKDIDYLLWYYNHQPVYKISDVDFPLHNKVCVDKILELSDEHCIYQDELWEISGMEASKKYEANREFLKEYGYYIAVIEKNVDDHGMLFVDGIEFYFPEIRAQYYQGFEYYLPAINGKAKRIKKKRVKIYSDTVKPNPYLDTDCNVVSNFEIIK